MLIYKKYIIKTILYPFLTVSFRLTGLVWITQILKLLYLLEKGIKLSNFFELIILIIPSIFFMILPLISTIAVIYAYSQLQETRELVILKMSGLSNFDLARPALFSIILVSFFAYYISLYLMPFFYRKLKYNLTKLNKNYISVSMIEEKTLNRISKDYIIYIEKK